MLPFIYEDEALPFKNGDYIFIPDIAKAVQDKATEIPAYAIDEDKNIKEFTLKLGEMTDDERDIILKGCLINYNKR
jgi:aconitate hydratase